MIAEATPAYLTAEYWENYKSRNMGWWYRRYGSVDGWIKAHPNRAAGRLVQEPKVRYYFYRDGENRGVLSSVDLAYLFDLKPHKMREIPERWFRAIRGMPLRGTVPQPVWIEPSEEPNGNGHAKTPSKASQRTVLEAVRFTVPAGRLVTWLADLATAKQLEAVLGKIERERT